MAEVPKAIFVVLSDLHFGAEFNRPAELPTLYAPGILNCLAPKIRSYFERACNSHDIGILISLPMYLKKLRRYLVADGYPNTDFDLYLVLGDLATYTNGASYVFLREYLTNHYYPPVGYSICPGMAIPPERLVVIPGNHDKLLCRDTSIYFSQFVNPLNLPNGPTPQRSLFLSRLIAGIEFLFILLDANIYATKDKCLDRSCFKHVAKGEVSDALFVEVSSKLKKLRSGDSVDNIKLSNYESAIKILLVHYAVNPLSVHGYLLPPSELILPHDCPHLDELVGSLRSDLRLVVHGHLHHPKIYNVQGVQVVSATTTTQLSKGKNGFFLLKFFASGDIRAEHHRWERNGFVIDPTPELNMTL
jgi:hypothetical protein